MRSTVAKAAVVLAVLVWVLGGFPLMAQEARFEEELQVSEVLLDVLVTDADGNVIVGLNEDDFIIEEDGERREVESVTFYSNRQFLPLGNAEPALEGLTEAEAPQDRYFVLFFYRPPLADSRASDLFLRLTEAGRKSFAWVVEELLPNDHVAVVAYGSRLDLYSDFTLDRRAVGKAIRRACAGRPPEQWPSRTPESLPGITLESLPPEEELRDRTADVYGALETLSSALGTVQGRKNIVLFGIDLPVHGGFGSDQQTPVRYPPAVEALNDNNVAVYPIALSRRTDSDRFVRLAEDTGGNYAFNFANFSAPLRQIARENNGYYLLSYRSSHPVGESGYQKIAVRTASDEFQVRSRGGYVYGE
jgi:VWFA-related protein